MTGKLFQITSVIVGSIIGMYPYREIDTFILLCYLNRSLQGFWVRTGDNEFSYALCFGMLQDCIQVIIVTVIIQVTMCIDYHISPILFFRIIIAKSAILSELSFLEACNETFFNIK